MLLTCHMTCITITFIQYTSQYITKQTIVLYFYYDDNGKHFELEKKFLGRIFNRKSKGLLTRMFKTNSK